MVWPFKKRGKKAGYEALGQSQELAKVDLGAEVALRRELKTNQNQRELIIDLANNLKNKEAWLKNPFWKLAYPSSPQPDLVKEIDLIISIIVQQRNSHKEITDEIISYHENAIEHKFKEAKVCLSNLEKHIKSIEKIANNTIGQCEVIARVIYKRNAVARALIKKKEYLKFADNETATRDFKNLEEQVKIIGLISTRIKDQIDRNLPQLKKIISYLKVLIDRKKSDESTKGKKIDDDDLVFEEDGVFIEMPDKTSHERQLELEKVQEVSESTPDSIRRGRNVLSNTIYNLRRLNVAGPIEEISKKIDFMKKLPLDTRKKSLMITIMKEIKTIVEYAHNVLHASKSAILEYIDFNTIGRANISNSTGNENYLFDNIIRNSEIPSIDSLKRYASISENVRDLLLKIIHENSDYTKDANFNQ